MDDVNNSFAVHSSILGPLFSSVIVQYAITDAIMTAGQKSDIEGYFEL